MANAIIEQNKQKDVQKLTQQMYPLLMQRNYQIAEEEIALVKRSGSTYKCALSLTIVLLLTPLDLQAKVTTENFNTYPEGNREEKDTFETANNSWEIGCFTCEILVLQ